MPPKKAATPKKTITKSAVKKTTQKKAVVIGDIVSIKKNGAVMNAICREYQGQNGIVCGYKNLDTEIQVMFTSNDNTKMPWFPAQCCTVLSEKKKKQFWKDFDYAVSFAKAQIDSPLNY